MVSCLQEIAPPRKNKISLTDYNYQKDIENRLLMAQFTNTDLEILEEILYSPIQIPLQRLLKNLEKTKEEVSSALQKFAQAGLLSFEGDTLLIDKETRKYFEFQIEKFDEDFTPGMEFLQSLLKKPPIHVLPIWYAIPRTSNNIFDSLLEKHLQTPQIFQRYIMELNFGEPVLKSIIETVYSSPNFEIPSKELIEKYNISRELFEEYMLHLEFSFVCCIGYRKIGESWEETVTPFHEWSEYLKFLRDTESPSLQNVDQITLYRPSEFSFVQDLAIVLDHCQKAPISIEKTKEGFLVPSKDILNRLLPLFPGLAKDPSIYLPYIHHLIQKLNLVRLATLSENKLTIAPAAEEWLSLRLDNQALYLYRHPRNKILDESIDVDSYTEKALREAEKSICRILHKNWVLFDDFFKGILVPLREDLAVSLKKTGRSWEYAIPRYTEEDCRFLKATVLQWLFEAGIVQIGTCQGQTCLRVTTLGQTLFGK